MGKRYWHFTNGRALRDGQPIPAIGEWLGHAGPLIPCKSGLHASEHPFDALAYAPGPILHLVELGGEIVEHGKSVDKVVARRRKIVKTVDMTEPLKKFARLLALSVAKNLPKGTDPVVLEWLRTGDEKLRSVARSAAESVAWSAAQSAAEVTAANAAANAAANGAEIVAESAARSAAEIVARSEARSVAWSAAASATANAAWSAARDQFLKMVQEVFEL